MGGIGTSIGYLQLPGTYYSRRPLETFHLVEFDAEWKSQLVHDQ